MKKFISVACIILLGFVFVGCNNDYELTVNGDELAPMIFDVEVLEIHDKFILARGLDDVIQGNLTFNYSHLPEIDIFVGANLTLIAEPIILETYPMQVRVIEWRHSTISLEISELKWSGWSSAEPKPEIQIKEVHAGQVVMIYSMHGVTEMEIATATIMSIQDDYVTVRFDGNRIIAPLENSFSDNEYWVVQINFNESYSVTTQTMSSGIDWTFTFSR